MKFKDRKFYTSLLPVVASGLIVAATVFASTTISTSISTDGNLTVTGVGTFNGQLQASSTALFGAGVTAYSTVLVPSLTVGATAASNSLDGTILFASRATDPTGVTQGTVYYNSTSKVLKLFDGTNWFTTGTTTSGISLSGARLQLADLTTQYLTIGTTTQQASGQAVVTLEATTTTSIPLVLVGYNSQTSNLFSIRNASSANLLYVNTSGFFATGTLQVTGAVTTYGATTLGDAAGDTITLTGNTSALGTLNVTGLTTLAIASSTGSVSLNGTTANFMVNGMATTTASSGNIFSQGTLGLGTTTSSGKEVTVSSSATTTLYLDSTSTGTSGNGGCIQLMTSNRNDTAGKMYRLYATTTGFAIFEAGTCE
ncbi:MAG: hypothetical protein A3C06_00620 [Candidatus Taylorbacteria bacterium RIFCSPHIGHO2_02_FULL_46_13]|uniref:Uncharacterized protein n=1 Tax=Candidatus Taylorbacteria bacterium RIFCSPHIGHO2_02_FULL_46_13 TaxID=1802312 RepID=A0A1G2MVR2_9BACT|nr:MAG: hypothetical protein A3C06_00620 [Candidatus Taylorbacteria bacterium RIFCSPHIGHO2_02_FULL_46_13]